MYLYHLTDKNKTAEILKGGLIPQIGANSNLAREDNPAVYLCSHKDIAYWQIILGKPVILRVEISDEELSALSFFNYSTCGEYISHKPISADRLKQIYMSKPSNKHMQDICLSYVHTMSYICCRTARYYEYKDKPEKIDYNEAYLDDTLSELKASFIATLTVLHKLDYSNVNMANVRAELRAAGYNGTYTLCDRFKDTKHRLWKMLIKYPDDELAPLRKDLHDYIRTNLKGCLYVKTGGWTG